MYPEEVPPAGAEDMDDFVLLRSLHELELKHPQDFKDQPLLKNAIQYLTAVSPETVLQQLNGEIKVEGSTINDIYNDQIQVIRELRGYLESGHVKDEVLAKEILHRLLRREIYLAAYKPEDTTEESQTLTE